MSIRWRLTLWFALIMCGILIITGVVLHVLLQNYLYNQVDDDLRVYSAQVHGTLHLDEIPEPLDPDVIHSNLPDVNEFASPGIYIQLIDQTGNVVVKSDNLGAQELPVKPSLIEQGFAGNVGIETVSAGADTDVRIMVSPLYYEHQDEVQTLLLEVAQSLKHVDSIMSQLRWVLLIGVLLALALAVISGGLIIRRVLAPVRRITRTAQTIEASSDLDRRVSYNGPMDEVGQLAHTFDHMIEHLDRAFESQKHFVGDASHELRGPLTVLKGNLDLLKRDLNEQERQESLRAMRIETDRMIKIVDDLLLLAEIESGHEEQNQVVSLNEILEEGLSRGQQSAGKRRISIGRQETLSIKGSAHRLRQLIDNLVINAIRYTGEEGDITLSLFRDGDYACLEVTDTGIGIEPEHLEHIFERFYRADKARSRVKGGIGIGLVIVKEIAEQHGGTVTVVSEPGTGSTFTVRLKL